MKESITIRHELPHFIVDKEPELKVSGRDKEIYVTRGHSDNNAEKECPNCGRRMHVHGSRESVYQDIELIGHLHYIIVRLERYICPECGYSRMQKPGFAAEGHRITERLRRRIIIRMNNGAVNHSQYSRQEKERISSFS